MRRTSDQYHALPPLLRSRRVAAWLAVAAASTTVLRVVAGLLVDTFDESSEVSTALGMYAVTISAAAAGPGMAGADLDLDQTAAIDWRPLRLAHVLLIGVLVAGLVTATVLTGHTLGPSQQIVRNAIGFTGILALAATTLGVARAWVPLVLLAVAGPYLAFQLGTNAPTWTSIITWPVHPPTSGASWMVAITLAAAGTAAYTLAGPRA